MITRNHMVDGSDPGTLGLCAISHRAPNKSSKFHHSTGSDGHEETFQVNVYKGMVQIKRLFKPTHEKRPGSRRGRITGFSPKSRKRLIETCTKIRKSDQGFFLTLTYPGKYHGDHEKTKRDLDTFSKRMARRFPGFAMLWRMEIKTRQTGASKGKRVPHYHGLCPGTYPGFVTNDGVTITLGEYIAKSWNEIVAPGDSDHLEHGSHVFPYTSARHAMSYVSKYVAKLEFHENAQEEYAGRHWGVVGDLETTISITVTISRQKMIEMKRLWRKWMRARGNDYANSWAMNTPKAGCTLFGWGDENSPGNVSLFDSAIFRLIYGI